MSSHRQASWEVDQVTSDEGESNLRESLIENREASNRKEHRITNKTETLSVATTTATEPTASLSSSPRSISSSFESDTKSSHLLDACFVCALRSDEIEVDACFVCALRSDEIEELEQRLKILQANQQELEDEILCLTEEAETKDAEFETLSALSLTDRKERKERLRLLEDDNAILVSSFNDLAEEKTKLEVELQEAEARTDQRLKMLQTNQQELEDEILCLAEEAEAHAGELESLSALSLADRNDLQERLRLLEDDKSILERSFNACFVCALRSDEIEELEQRLKILQANQQELEDEILCLTEEAETKDAEFETLSALSLTDRKERKERLRLLEDDNAILVSSFNDLAEEKTKLEVELQEAEARTDQRLKMLQTNQQELEDEILCLTEEAEAHAGEFEILSALSLADRNDLQERLRLLQDDKSILERSFNNLAAEKANLEVKLREAASRATRTQTLMVAPPAVNTHKNGTNLLKDRIQELVREKAAIACHYDNALHTTKKHVVQKETQIQRIQIEALEESTMCNQLREERTVMLAQVESLSLLAARRLTEKEEADARLLTFHHKMRKETDYYEKGINAYETELESLVLTIAKTEANNSNLVAQLESPSSLSASTLADKAKAETILKTWLEQMREETDCYKASIKAYETELESLEKKNSGTAEAERKPVEGETSKVSVQAESPSPFAAGSQTKKEEADTLQEKMCVQTDPHEISTKRGELESLEVEVMANGVWLRKAANHLTEFSELVLSKKGRSKGLRLGKRYQGKERPHCSSASTSSWQYAYVLWTLALLLIYLIVRNSHVF